MTTITVRLIFWGLVGFVPDLDGTRSLTALLVDPARTQIQEKTCSFPPHYSVVYLLDGECEGDCRKVPPNREPDAALMGFDQQGPGKRLPLAWLLDQEELGISGEEDERLKLQKPWLSFLHRKAPRSDRQVSHFSWVQSMNRLTGGNGRVLDDCLGASTNCPLQARFRLQGGEASACHLFHERENSSGPERNVQIFEYQTANGRNPKRVAADAALVEFEQEGDSVILESQGLPERNRSRATARLIPNKDRIITLVVANLPEGPRNGELHHHRDCSRPHSDALLDLLKKRPSRLPNRKPAGTVRLNPGACEKEAAVLADLLSGASGEIPHSTTSCDGASYP